MTVALPGREGAGARPRAARALRATLGIGLLLLGVWLRRSAAWLLRSLPALAAGLAAAIPVLVSTVHAVNAGWQPAGDDGIIATRAWDVLTSHSPLIGQYSEAGNVTGQVVHSPGPMLYWLLALPARFGSVSSLAVTMGIVNTLAIIGCVALARRRGGLLLMFATAVAIALMCQSLASESFHDIWNPAAALFPFMLLIFVCWSVACGDHRLLPVMVLLASFVTQTHLTYVAPAAGMLVIGLAGLACGRLAERWRGDPRLARGWRLRVAGAGDGARTRRREPPAPLAGEDAGPPAGADEDVPARVAGAHRGRRRSRLWRWALAAVLVGALCWALPIIDEIEHDPGNLTLVVRTSQERGRTLGAGIGWNAVVDAVGWKPWWLFVPASEWNRKVDVRASASDAQVDSTLAMLAALGLVGLAGLARRRRDLAAGALIGFVMCAGLAANVSQTPVVPLLAATIGYTAWWGSMLGMWIWLMLAWALWLALSRLPRASRHFRRARARWRAPAAARARLAACVLASLACLGGVAEAGAAVAGTEKPDSHVNQYRPISYIVARLIAAVPAHTTVRFSLGANNVSTQPMEPAIRFGLVRHGDLVLSQGAYYRLGYYYELEHKPYRWYVYIADGRRSRRHMVRVATVDFTTGFGHNTFSAYVGEVGPGHRLHRPAGLHSPAPVDD